MTQEEYRDVDTIRSRENACMEVARHLSRREKGMLTDTRIKRRGEGEGKKIVNGYLE